MFDEVRVEVGLPDGYTGRHFQTKDLDCGLDHYRISAEGRLLVEDYELHVLPADPAKTFSPPFRRESKGWRDTHFHGILNFYASPPPLGHRLGEGGRRGHVDSWHEYDAEFTDGQLVGLTVVPDQRVSR